MIAQFELHLERCILQEVDFDADAILKEAARLSERHTIRAGVRSFDILHVATALILGARELLTFDAKQRMLAEAEGLTIPF
jgi:predicted nucleic acid-binding protein